jgi:predicted  nucleic acid-binding Zn-ribbon protein
MPTHDSIAECERRVEEIRRALEDQHAEEDRLLRASEARREALREFTSRPQPREGERVLPPHENLRRGRLEGEVKRLEQSLAQLRQRIEATRGALEAEQRECWNLRRDRTEAPSPERLREVIDDRAIGATAMRS